ncbi:hypothetical protein [Paenibacillus larvae]|uniref:hypothetical protein n=1 Tax=Paenibacillus larvae TaxID=1464 RepID=UPI00288F2C25|nr:hypothetical protein [Paenibacillus larvae]MDT2194282.1 hypothetical protein [Paenibacillus larvae]MDT2236804.1 hypothetical protein [Paenibacillus larvae]MDT2242040.1 hypothetical protein [Paenibacillus larvae]MDT2255016.1 hypothetical protein [Paenibacillus larvae]MDT2260802.1 hypothetical protein [Paenibacillus larvae]
MNKKYGKKLLVLATVASIGTSFTALDSASAAQVNNTNYKSQIEAQKNIGIVDWKEPFQDATNFIGTFIINHSGEFLRSEFDPAPFLSKNFQLNRMVHLNLMN